MLKVGDDRAAKKRAGPRGQLYAQSVAETAPGLRLCGSRTVQQPRGELYAAGRFGAEELAPRGQHQGWAKGGSDSLDSGILPPLAPARSAVPTRHPARP